MNENDMFSAKNQLDGPTLREYNKAVPPKVCREIVDDHLGKPTSFPTTPGETPGLMRFSDPVPLGPPPGIAVMDQMMAEQDRNWRSPLAVALRKLLA